MVPWYRKIKERREWEKRATPYLSRVPYIKMDDITLSSKNIVENINIQLVQIKKIWENINGQFFPHFPSSEGELEKLRKEKLKEINLILFAARCPRKSDGSPDWADYWKKAEEVENALRPKNEKDWADIQNFVEQKLNPDLENCLNRFPSGSADNLQEINQWFWEYEFLYQIGGGLFCIRKDCVGFDKYLSECELYCKSLVFRKGQEGEFEVSFISSFRIF